MKPTITISSHAVKRFSQRCDPLLKELSKEAYFDGSLLGTEQMESVLRSWMKSSSHNISDREFRFYKGLIWIYARSKRGTKRKLITMF